jgi:hypothetical protein
MIDHVIVTFIALATVLFISAAVPTIDKVDTGKLWQAAHERAVREGK